MIAMASKTGLMPEQVWDAAPIEAARLYPGRPSGSAMPLAWTHSEFIKLAASHHLGRPCDRPESVWQRYRGKRPQPDRAFWMRQAPISTVAAGQALTIALPRPAILHGSTDNWATVTDTPTQPIGLGLHGAEIPANGFGPAGRIVFTWRWQDDRAWVGQDFSVRQQAMPTG
jgi:glucoamylase